MSKSQNIRRNKIALRATAAAAAMAAASLLSGRNTARAANVTWSGSGTTDNWSEGANWAGTAPVNLDALFFDGNLRLTTNTNDIAANTSFAGITFNTGAGAFTLSGNPITLTGNVLNTSSNVQTINGTLNFAASRTINGGTPGIVLGGTLANTAASGNITLTFNGTGKITGSPLGGSAAGTLLTFDGASTNWSFLGNNTVTVPSTNKVNLNVINGATVNFGSATDAPTLALTATANAGTDNQVGTSGSGTFNMVNGNLTMGVRFNTTNTATVNQTGGNWQIWNQVQISNGALANTATFNLSGGKFDVRNSTGSTEGGGPLYVASRGAGTLNISGTALVECSTLDVSRDITNGSNGVVNLNGGTLLVNTRVTTASNASVGTNTLSTGTFNFNGGTLRAGGSSTTFFNHNQQTNANDTPLNLIVKSGGAIIDSNGFNDTTVLPFQHDATLGATPDGGFTKNGAGTFTFGASSANTYTGTTTINAGTLQIGDGGANGSFGAGNTVNNAALVYNSGNSQTYAGVISGSGTFTMQAASTLTLTGVHTYTGNTTVSAGTLQIGAGGSLGASNNIIVASGATFDATATGHTINAGKTLVVNGTATGALTLSAAGGKLGGTGTAGAVTMSNGSINPGAAVADNNIGTLALSSLSDSGGDLRFDIAPIPDLINVSGSASFGGGSTLSLNLAGGVTTGQQLTLLQAGTLTGVPTLSTTTLGRNTFSIDNPQLANNRIVIDVGGNAGNLRWTSASGGTPSDGVTWEQTQLNKNWFNLDSSTADFFYQADNVTFDDTNGGAYAVTVSGTVSPGNMTVNNSGGNYVFGGAGSIGGVATLTKSGSSALTINTTGNSYSGGVVLNAGTINVNTATALGTGRLTINGGTIDNTSGNAVTLTSNNPQTWNSSFTFIGSNSLNMGSGAVSLGADTTITVGNNSLTVGGVIADGTGTAITKAGTGTLTLSGANTYSGVTTVNAGILQAGAVGALGNASAGTVINSGASFEINNIALNTTEQFTISGTGVGGLGAIVNNTATTSAINHMSRVQLAADASIGGIGRWDFRGNSPVLELNGFTLTKVGTNQVSIVAGTIQSTSGTGHIVVANGVLSIETTTSATGSGDITYNAGIPAQFFQNTGDTSGWTMNFLGANNIGNASTTGGTVNSPTTISGDVTFVPLLAGVPQLNSNFPLTWSGSITESGGARNVTKDGINTLVLSGNNTWTGNTNVVSGILAAGSSTGFSPSSVVNFNPGTGTTTATLRANGVSPTVGGLQSNPAALGTSFVDNGNLSGSNLTIQNASDNTFAGVVQDGAGGGALGIVKTGNATQVLSGANTYTGSTQVNTGTLQIGAGGTTGTLGSAAVTINGGAFLAFNRSNSVTVANQINGSGQLRQTGSGTTVLTNSNSYDSTLISAGTLQIGAGGTAGTLGNGNVTTNATLAFNRSDSVQIFNNIDGTGGVSQNGAATVSYFGTGTYSGTTNVNAGTLSIVGSLANGGNVAVNSGGTLGGTGSVGTVTVNSGGHLAPGLSPGNLTLSNLNFLSGGDLSVDLNGPNPGSDYDTLTILHNATFAGGTITPTSINVPTGDYVLATATDSLTGAAPTASGGGSRNLFSVELNTGLKELILHVTAGAPHNLTWTGAAPGDTTTWQSGNPTQNWINDSNALDSFFNFDNVTFNNSGANKNVTVVGTVNPGSVTFSNTAGNDYTIGGSGSIGGATGVAVNGGGKVTVTTNNAYTGATTIDGGSTLQVGNGGTSGSLGSTTAISGGSGTLRFSRSDTLAVPNAITGSIGVNVAGGGTIGLSATTNTYSGNTTVESGTLRVDAANATSPNSALVLGSGGTSGTLNLNGNSTAVGGLSNGATGAANIVTNGVNNPATLTVGGAAVGTFAGLIQNGLGTTGLTVNGPDLTLSAANTYTGGTTVNAGTVRVDPGGTMGATSSALLLGDAGGTLTSAANAVFNTSATIGSFNQTTQAAVDTLVVAAGQTLTVAGTFTVGQVVSNATTGQFLNSFLGANTPGSGGTLNVNGAMTIALNPGAANKLTATVDLSNLSNFNLNAAATTLNIGNGTNNRGIVTLAGGTNSASSNLINVATINMGTSGGGNANGGSRIDLGGGSNTIQANNINIGAGKSTATIQFVAGAPSSASVTIGGTGGGAARTTILMDSETSGTGNGPSNLLLAGHNANVQASTVTVASDGGSGGTASANVTFDTGTFNVNSLILGAATSGGAATTGTFTLGNTANASTGQLVVNNSLLLTNATGGTGAVTANLNIIGGNASINTDITNPSTRATTANLTVDGGTLDMLGHNIGSAAAPINLTAASGTIKNVAQINGGGGLTKTGTGLLTLDGTNTYTGVTTVSAGTLAYNTGYVTGNGFDVADGATLSFVGTPHVPVLPTQTFKTPSVNTHTSGKLDIGDNRLIITTPNSTGTWNGSSYEGTSGQIASGRNGGGWGGSGIVTSQAPALSGNFTSIAVATAAQVKGIGAAATATWGGQTVTGTDTLVMYTYGGDANLDGKINVDDYGRIDFNVNLGTSGWFNGDFNYDGKINVDDYGIIDFNVGIQGAPFATGSSPLAGVAASSSGLAGVSAVPEPGAASLLILSAAGALCQGSRRRRHRDDR